jgi:hypothetical protein
MANAWRAVFVSAAGFSISVCIFPFMVAYL